MILDLGGNSIDDEGVQSLAEALKINRVALALFWCLESYQRHVSLPSLDTDDTSTVEQLY